MEIVTDSIYSVQTSKKFRKQLNKIVKQGKDINKLIYVVKLLANDDVLELKYHHHKLIDNKNFKNCMELHIEPDWLLIYKFKRDKLILLLVETGSHSEVL